MQYYRAVDMKVITNMKMNSEGNLNIRLMTGVIKSAAFFGSGLNVKPFSPGLGNSE